MGSTKKIVQGAQHELKRENNIKRDEIRGRQHVEYVEGEMNI